MTTKHKRKILYAAAFLFLTGILLLSYTYFIEPHRLVVNQHELKIANWNPAFNNFKIVAVSDIHGGSNCADGDKLRQVVETINAQNADLVVFLGDYVSEYMSDTTKLKMPVETIADNLAGIRSKYGVLMVLGNHDGYYSDRLVRQNFERVGYRVLENELAVIEKDGERLRVLGLKDHTKMGSWQRFSADARAVLETNDQRGDVIALEHSPDILPVVTGDLSISDDLKLMLAGHTHGGQVWFPILGSIVVPSSYGQKYAFGHTRENDVDIFVTTGIGTSILPFRFLVPPEIAVLTITSGS